MERESPRKGVIRGKDGGERQEMVRVRRPPGLPATRYLALDYRGDIVIVVVGLSVVLTVHCVLDSSLRQWMLETMAAIKKSHF